MLLRAGDIMNRDRLPIAAAGASLKDGLAEISAKGWGCVGVVDGARRLVGIVTDGDVRRLLASGAKAERVGDAMTTSPVTTTPDALAAKVLHVMNERKITQIFVVENGAPVGIIHMHDLIRAGLA
jgi:arabinose-5-phosphate isomerase